MIETGERILILGLAREGVSLARYAAAAGAAVTVTDRAPAANLGARLAGLPASVRVVVGGDHPELVRDADRFFVSPGVPESNAVYGAARAASLAAESMTTLFFALCPAPILGVTGSSGKTTTTSLIAHILCKAGRDVALGGNIGDPMLDLLPSITPETQVVLELSSFQLLLLRRSPHIAVVTNISPNHLDRHPSMEEYVAAKEQIVAHQSASDYVVLNTADACAPRFARCTPAQQRWFGSGSQAGADIQDGWIVLREGGQTAPVIPLDDIPLLGAHNMENVLAAVVATAILDISPHDMARAIRTYRPPAHRLQFVAERDGVRYVNDSIATSPARAAVALRAIDAPIVLIAGGRDKNLPWEDFAALAAERCAALILIGEAADRIERAVEAALRPGSLLRRRNIRQCPSLEEAVSMAERVAQPGQVVLLSPACTSYDMFTDFAERGERFTLAVEACHAA